MIETRLKKLRQLMSDHQLDYYLVPSTDPHQSEYVPAHWQRRAWLAGFTGSQGEALIGHDQAGLWTDSRYFIQAEQELDSAFFQLMKQLPGKSQCPEQWLADQGKPIRLGVDAQLITIARYQCMVACLPKGSELVAVEQNLVDIVKQQSKPFGLTADCDTHALVTFLPDTGQSTPDKLGQIRQKMRAASVDAMLISTLDDIAWILNVRGQDIDYNPLVVSYLWLTEATVVWCVDRDKVDQEDQAHLVHIGIEIQPYHAVAQVLLDFSGTVWLDTQRASWWVKQKLSNCHLHDAPVPSTLLKACKNDTELSGIQAAHHADGLAMVKFLYWLDTESLGKTECDLSDQLDQFRTNHPECRGLSFPTIMGYGQNGAIVHYEALPKSAAKIGADSLLLFDSGGQYTLGTTDVTRVVHLGQPTALQKRYYTLVLKGHIALARMVFPAGTSGTQLDMAARQFLWQDGLDYGHGTGHGVGAYLCVHEGPQNISPALRQQALLPGMVVSNEPGVYLTGQFGIRIENLCYVVERFSQQDSPMGHGPFYGFETLTLAPYSRDLIALGLLTAQEITWVNHYHAQVLAQLSKDLSKQETEWLTQACQALS